LKKGDVYINHIPKSTNPNDPQRRQEDKNHLADANKGPLPKNNT